jgi:hypothetical protein
MNPEVGTPEILLVLSPDEPTEVDTEVHVARRLEVERSEGDAIVTV